MQHIVLCPLKCILTITLLLQHSLLARTGCPPASSVPAVEGFVSGDQDSAEMYSAASHEWMERDKFCYRFVPDRRPWYLAEQVCRIWNGHLVAIRTIEENRLIGRLTDCQPTWIGKFSTDYHRVQNPETYAWTEDDANGATRPPDDGFSHPISQQAAKNSSLGDAVDAHAGAVRAEGMAWFNTHYHQLLPFVCKSHSIEHTLRCPDPLVQFGTSCYWLSNFATSFVDANLHCEREIGGHLTSVHSQAEARFISSLELDTDNCVQGQFWLGLIRQSPCRTRSETANGRAAESCYQWTDLSGEYKDYPPWAAGHPLNSEPSESASSSHDAAWKTNCATLAGDGLRSEKCHVRLRFVCKVDQDKAKAVVSPSGSDLFGQTMATNQPDIQQQQQQQQQQLQLQQQQQQQQQQETPTVEARTVGVEEPGLGA